MTCGVLFQDPSVTQVTHPGVDHVQQYQPFPGNDSVSIHNRIRNISNEGMSGKEKEVQREEKIIWTRGLQRDLDAVQPKGVVGGGGGGVQ